LADQPPAGILAHYSEKSLISNQEHRDRRWPIPMLKSIDDGQMRLPIIGDGFGALFGAALVNPGSKTGITDQVLWGLKATNITDGSQDSHGGNHAEAWDLHQVHCFRQSKTGSPANFVKWFRVSG